MRHHYEPQRRTPSINLGQSGSFRVTSDPDPEFEPLPFLGFTHVVWTRRATGEAVAVGDLGPLVRTGEAEPLLWEGDQA